MRTPKRYPTSCAVRHPDHPHAAHPNYPSERSARMPSAKFAAFLENEMRQQFPEMFQAKESNP